MKNVLEHKGYVGSVEFSAEDEIFFGKIVGIRDVVTFEGTSVKEITKAFKESVDDYIATCHQLGKDPDKAYKGSFNVRVKPAIHRLISTRAQALKISLNQYIERVLEKEVSTEMRREEPILYQAADNEPPAYKRIKKKAVKKKK